MKVISADIIHTTKHYKYIADDGTEFGSARECQNYEYRSRLRRIRTCDYPNFEPFIGTFYFIDSEDTLKWLVCNVFGDKRTTIFHTDIVIGDWVAVHVTYYDNMADDYDLITLTELKNRVAQAIEKGTGE